MSGEIDLHALLRTMTPELQDGEFVFCSVSERELTRGSLSPLCIFREREGITVILTREEAECYQLHYTYVARMITLTVHSSLDAVGFLAVITAKLAEHAISVNAVSAYYHDHLFVPVERANDAVLILKNLSQQEATHDV